jgi:hypothetical protein
VVTSWATEAKRLPSSGSIGGERWEQVKWLASKGYGENQEHERKGALLHSPCFVGGDTGVAGAHIVLISPVKILIREVIGGLLETA